MFTQLLEVNDYHVGAVALVQHIPLDHGRKLIRLSSMGTILNGQSKFKVRVKYPSLNGSFGT